MIPLNRPTVVGQRRQVRVKLSTRIAAARRARLSTFSALNTEDSDEDSTRPPSKMADALDHQTSGRTRIEWLSSLNTEYKPAKNYRRTSIICTIGPKTNSAEKINVLRKGMNYN